MNWIDAIGALYGVHLSEKQADTWEYYLSKLDVGNAELVNAIEEASERNEKTRGYRATVYDLTRWIKKSRNNWRDEFRGF